MGLEFVQKPEQTEANKSPDWIADIDFQDAVKLAKEGNNAARASDPQGEAKPDDASKASGPMPFLELYDSAKDEEGKLDSKSADAGKPEKDTLSGGKPDARSDGDSTMSGEKETPQGIDPGTFEAKPNKVEEAVKVDQEGPF